jgi:hypothetical protein
MICGAKTRSCTPCKQRSIYANGRCKFHGGLATGPITEAGKEQCRINGRKGGRPRKDAAEKTEVMVHQGNVKGDYPAPLVTEPVFAGMETEVLELDKTGLSSALPKGGFGGGEVIEMSTDVHVLSSREKAKMLKDVKVSDVPLACCGDCVNLSASWACMAVARGEIPAENYRKSATEPHRCQGFSAWRT